MYEGESEGPKAVESTRQPEVQRSLTLLNSEIDAAEKAVEKLEGRLASIMRTELKADGKPEGRAKAQCDLADGIDTSRHRVTNLLKRIGDITSRLEV